MTRVGAFLNTEAALNAVAIYALSIGWSECRNLPTGRPSSKGLGADITHTTYSRKGQWHPSISVCLYLLKAEVHVPKVHSK